MSNVVPITAAVKEPPGLDVVRVLSALKRLYFARVIDTDAMFLGTQVLQLMAAHDTNTVALTHKQAHKTYVIARNQIIAGRVTASAEDFTVALQQLHYHALLFSALTSDAFEMAGNCHFTQDASIMSPAFAWGTPIHFAFDPERIEELEAYVLAEFDRTTHDDGDRAEFNIPSHR